MVDSAAGSDPAPGGGSVIAKHDRIAPDASGFSQRSFCASVPTISMRCMLPSSGADRFIASGPSTE